MFKKLGKGLTTALSEMVETFAISLAIFLAIYTFLAFPEVVVGASMEPTLYTGERLLVERVTPALKKLKRGHVIIFKPPGNRSIDYVKRIVGLPGETLVIKDCRVYLEVGPNNEIKLDEDYLRVGTCTVATEGTRVTVPKDSFFVMGDNRNQSADSRFFGFLPFNRVEGKVVVRFWPLDRMSLF